MSNKLKIYNDLISGLNDEKSILSKKDCFLDNLNYVKELLNSGLSLNKQIEKYSNNIEKISRSLYENYCKEFLKKEYEQGLLKSLFHRNIKKIAYYISQEENPNSKDLYLLLLNSGSLKQARNKKDSSVGYDVFTSLLKNFLIEKGYEHLVLFNDLDNEIKTIQTKQDIEVSSDNVHTNKLNEKIKIEFTDNSFEYYKKDFLKKEFLVYEDSYIDNNIKEKNVYYIQARYIDKEYSFEKFKDVIKNNKVLENYSIIVHNNSSVDTRLYIYRFIDNQLIMLKSLDASSCVFELEELIRRGRANFFKKLSEYLEHITSWLFYKSTYLLFYYWFKWLLLLFLL